MSDIIPLQIYPWPVSDAQMTLVREAKAALDTDVKVMPTEAVPGLHERVLALGKLPPWLCDAAFVKDPSVKESLTVALEWYISAPPDDTRGFMVADYLSAIFGGEVREVPPLCHCVELGCDGLVTPRGEAHYVSRCGACHDAGCHLTKGLCLRD